MFRSRSIQLVLSIALLTGIVAPIVTTPAAVAQPIASSQTSTAQKRRIAVLDFDGGSIGMNPIASGWLGQGASKGISDLVVNQLVNSGSYRVIERSKVQALMREQDLGEMGRVDAGAKFTAYTGSGLQAVIADIGGGQVTINKGAIAGFSTGMKILVERVTKQVKDPSTGKVLRKVSSSIGAFLG